MNEAFPRSPPHPHPPPPGGRGPDGRHPIRNPPPLRGRAGWGGGLWLAVALILGRTPALRAQDDGPLAIADLPAYRAALEPPGPGDPEPRPSTFRELWDRPDESRGRRVKVGGRVE